MKKALILLIVIAACAGLGYYFYQDYQQEQAMLHPKFYSGNGRLEATEIYISSKLSGRIEKIFVEEGALVRKGDKLVRMQTNTLEAEKAAALAKIKSAEGNLAMAKAELKRKESSLEGAKKEYDRQKTLVASQAVSERLYEEAETRYKNNLADLEYAKASILAAEGKIAEAKAELQRIEADLNDSLLVATYDGRIQYLLAHEGEVLSAGGRALNLVNLTDAYMTFFLPTTIAGKVKMGAEVKLVFDARPDKPIPAKVTFIDPVAQFTPKSVETRVEREKMMFRIKAGVDHKLLEQYIENVKTGLPGVAWVKLEDGADWAEAPIQVAK
ncbi:MAG: HlyD family efflux transporter periplasmic adaptor subunit [Lentisphaeria bacterium]|nr:HlyD family efflux transporter periplasmic adaptor subunit [Lentisphaeria bacterium]